jgi:hypothetical protein
MRAIAIICGLTLAGGLSACAQSTGLSSLSLAGAGEPVDAGMTVASNGVEDAGGPPLPIRDERRSKSDPGATGEQKQAGLTLPRLSDVKLFTASAYAPDSAQWDMPPVDVYSQLAQRIHACWFTPGAPKLPDYGFHADVEPGDEGDAKIIIYKKDPEGKRGLQAFRIVISGGPTGSTVRAENKRLDSKLEQSFKLDLARWAKGKPDC